MPLVARCENSIRVSIRAARGMTSPLQSGQWLPHPAPAPVARTYTPHTITTTLKTSVPHANRLRERFVEEIGAITAEAVDIAY
jgi:hypothetical protein